MRGRNPELLDPFLSSALEKRHLWSASGILDEISREKFDIVFEARDDSNFGPAIQQSIARHYRPLCSTAKMIVLAPRDRAGRLSASDVSYTLRQSCE